MPALRLVTGCENMTIVKIAAFFGFNDQPKGGSMSKVLWPGFCAAEFDYPMKWFGTIASQFGLTSAQITKSPETKN